MKKILKFLSLIFLLPCLTLADADAACYKVSIYGLKNTGNSTSPSYGIADTPSTYYYDGSTWYTNANCLVSSVKSISFYLPSRHVTIRGFQEINSPSWTKVTNDAYFLNTEDTPMSCTKETTNSYLSCTLGKPSITANTTYYPKAVYYTTNGKLLEMSSNQISLGNVCYRITAHFYKSASTSSSARTTSYFYNDGTKWCSDEACDTCTMSSIDTGLTNPNTSAGKYPAFFSTGYSANAYTATLTADKTIDSSIYQKKYDCTYILGTNSFSCDFPLKEDLSLSAYIYVPATNGSGNLLHLINNTVSSGTLTVSPSFLPTFANINFWGLKPGYTSLQKLKTVYYKYADNKWYLSTSSTTPITSWSNLSISPLNISSAYTYNKITYSKGIKAFGALYAGRNDNDSAQTPNIPTYFISTKTGGKLSTTSKPNIISDSGYNLPTIARDILYSGKGYAKNIEYILLYAANCLNNEGVICTLKTTGGQVVYENACENGYSNPSFGDDGLNNINNITIKAPALNSYEAGLGGDDIM